MPPLPPGMTATPGAGVGVTITYTDWRWVEPFDSLEWEMRVEVEPADDGYIFAQEFSLEAGNTGLATLQANGGYQADPPGGATEIEKLVQFWIEGPPLRAELADIAYPDARAALVHDPQQRPEQKRIKTWYQLKLAPFRLCDALVSLGEKDGWLCKLALQRRKSEPESGRWSRPFQRWNFACHLEKKTC